MATYQKKRSAQAKAKTKPVPEQNSQHTSEWLEALKQIKW